MPDPLMSLRVPEERKEAWEDAVENSVEYTNLSDLIRKSVERELSDAPDPDAATAVDVDLGEVTDRLDEMQDQLDRLNRKMDRVAEADVGISEERERDIANQLQDHLPRVQSEKEMEDIARKLIVELADTDMQTLVEEERVEYGSIDLYAEYLDKPRHAVEAAARRLADDVTPIEMGEFSGDLFIYEVEG